VRQGTVPYCTYGTPLMFAFGAKTDVPSDSPRCRVIELRFGSLIADGGYLDYRHPLSPRCGTGMIT
jgi:hypothetical protein